MKTMKFATVAAAVALAATLAGCTAAAPEPVGPTVSAAAAPTTASPLPTEWTGTFVSQGVATSGTITIRHAGERPR